MAKSKSQEKREEIQKRSTETKRLVTYIGPGGLSGEYLFEEIHGSVVASSLEEAYDKAEEIAVKHPSFLNH